MTALKSRILRIWDTAPPTVRICCIKFGQRVVLAQTPSINQQPRVGTVCPTRCARLGFANKSIAR